MYVVKYFYTVATCREILFTEYPLYANIFMLLSGHYIFDNNNI